MMNFFGWFLILALISSSFFWRQFSIRSFFFNSHHFFNGPIFEYPFRSLSSLDPSCPDKALDCLREKCTIFINRSNLFVLRWSNLVYVFGTFFGCSPILERVLLLWETLFSELLCNKFLLSFRRSCTFLQFFLFRRRFFVFVVPIYDTLFFKKGYAFQLFLAYYYFRDIFF